MKAIALVVVIAAIAHGLPTQGGNVIMTFADDGITPIYEDLDEPVASAAAVDVNKLKFLLYTRQNRDSPQSLKVNDANALKNSYFSSGKPTKFLIHGWQNSYQAESVQIVKDAYLQSGDVNVFLLDYEAYNSPYISAVDSAESIGANFGNFINFLLSQGLSVNNVFIAGHSLGAHIAGFTANKVSGNVPRITGLDPAGPLFAGTKASARLSSDDANVVDVIHTSTSLGMSGAIGSVDYYPHGGAGQPACIHNIMPDGCDHASSYRYFAETISNNQKYPARACNSEKDAQVSDPSKSPCGKSSIFMGEIGHQGTGKYYYVEI